MDARNALYQNFDRKVGNPKQWIIHNFSEMNNFIINNSGINDECYASVCSFSGNLTIFDDLFLEEDNKNPKPISDVGQWYSDNDIPWIPIFSGSRSYHIHALFQPEIVHPDTVKKFAKQVISETHTEGLFDSHVVGNWHQMARIPNTQRLNGKWCIPLSYESILNQLPFDNIAELSNAPQFINYNITNRPSITEFVKDTSPESQSTNLPWKIPVHTTTKFLLRDFVRGCIYEKLCSANPSNMIRVAATRDALLLGLTPMQVLEGFSEQIDPRWVDFDPRYTKERIDYIYEHIKSGQARHYGKERLGCTKKNSCFKCLIGAV